MLAHAVGILHPQNDLNHLAKQVQEIIAAEAEGLEDDGGTSGRVEGRVAGRVVGRVRAQGSYAELLRFGFVPRAGAKDEEKGITVEGSPGAVKGDKAKAVGALVQGEDRELGAVKWDT